ncbi:MAG: uracil-DNA glycosylase family protein [Salinispira sp.]
MTAHDTLIEINSRLGRELDSIDLKTASWIYNPLDYAFSAVREYLELFTPSPGAVLFLGMNPGPWGMAQTGIPFGAVSAVRDWMRISPIQGRPKHEHPRVPVRGFECGRDEVSGKRFWNLMSARYPRAQDFFAEHFVINYCPLMFLDTAGRNLTPDKLPVAERKILFRLCDTALTQMIEIIQPARLIGIGNFAEKRLKENFSTQYPIHKLLHPSPANPAANRNWEGQARAILEDQGIWK